MYNSLSISNEVIEQKLFLVKSPWFRPNDTCRLKIRKNQTNKIDTERDIVLIMTENWFAVEIFVTPVTAEHTRFEINQKWFHLLKVILWTYIDMILHSPEFSIGRSFTIRILFIYKLIRRMSIALLTCVHGLLESPFGLPRA